MQSFICVLVAHGRSTQVKQTYLDARLLLTRTMDTLQKLYRAHEYIAFKLFEEDEPFSFPEL